MKTKAKIFQDIMKDARESHRLLCVDMLAKIRELEKPFAGKRFAFKTPRVKNRTYKVYGFETKHLSILPTNSRKTKSTGFLAIRNNASFFGYEISEIQLDFVKMQKDGYDEELLKIERTLHEEFSNKTRYIMMSTTCELAAHKILYRDADFYLASRGYKVNNLHSSSRHQGTVIGIEYNPHLAEIITKIETDEQGKHTIDNETHIVNIWS